MGGLTQYNALNGLVRGDTISQDGYLVRAVLDSVAVEADGRVVGSYTNGRVLPVAQITIAQFNADNALKRLDKGVYDRRWNPACRSSASTAHPSSAATWKVRTPTSRRSSPR